MSRWEYSNHLVSWGGGLGLPQGFGLWFELARAGSGLVEVKLS